MEHTKLTEILEKHKLWLEDDENGERADFKGADLEGADLEGADLEGANFKGANLEGADLRDADLEFSELQGANLKGADLEGADLHGANLKGADLKGANLRDADLEGVNLEGADLDFSCLPLWCAGLNFKIDERIAKQLTYHLINLMQHSDLKVSKIFKKEVYKWLEDSHLVKERLLPKIEEKESE